MSKININNSDLKKYLYTLIDENIHIIGMYTSQLNYNLYSVRYDYDDEDGFLLSGKVYFDGSEYVKYLRSKKIDKLKNSL